jgi:hypothetical protein
MEKDDSELLSLDDPSPPKVICITDHLLMRGIDLRAPERGLMMII